jgi:hypothetical protein
VAARTRGAGGILSGFHPGVVLENQLEAAANGWSHRFGSASNDTTLGPREAVFNMPAMEGPHLRRFVATPSVILPILGLVLAPVLTCLTASMIKSHPKQDDPARRIASLGWRRNWVRMLAAKS